MQIPFDLKKLFATASALLSPLSVLLLLFIAALMPARAAAISYVQGTYAMPTKTATLTASYGSAQIAGDMNIIAIGWDSATITLKSGPVDTKGNVYKLAVTYVDTVGNTQAIYYAPNIAGAAAGTNSVTVTLSASSNYPDLRITEYSGVNSLDQTASAKGTATTASSGAKTTTQPNELLFGALYNWGSTNAVGSGYTQRLLDNNAALIEDEVIATTGSHAATATVSGGSQGEWLMQLATFYESGATIPAAPTGLTAAATASAVQLNWTASTGATSYTVLRSTTSGTGYAVPSGGSGLTTTSFLDSTAAAGKTYYYVVEAVNSAGTSGYSNQASAEIGSAPSTPTGLSATAASATLVNVSWTASAGATSYTVLRSTTSGSGFAIPTGGSGLTSPAFADSTVSASTTYYYEVEAVNSSGTSAPSSQFAVTTPAGGTTYYVSKTGSNSNLGTEQSPWLTIQYAASKVAAGSTVIVGPGIYYETVTITTTGEPGAPIVFQGSPASGGLPQTTIDGTGLPCCATLPYLSGGTVANGQLENTLGLINVGATNGISYLTIEGFIVQNFTVTNNVSIVPAGIFIATGGSNIFVSNNTIQNISNTTPPSNGNNPNSYPVGIFGTSATPLSITFNGNIVTGNFTGQSETVAFNGNIQNFNIFGNQIYGNDNIGLDIEGFYNMGPSGYDQPFNGRVYNNDVYDNSAINNPGAGGSYYDADGIYCDGCREVVIEQNLVHENDFGIEASSENPGKVASYVIIRNNVVYGNNAVGITVGGYYPTGTCTGDCGGGGSQNIYVVNNTLYANDMSNNEPDSSADGELQTQFRTSGIYMENNIVDDAQNDWFYNYNTSPASPYVLSTLGYNDYYSTTSSGTPFTLSTCTNKDVCSTATVSQSAAGDTGGSISQSPQLDSPPVCTFTYKPIGGGSNSASSCTASPNLDIPSGSQAFASGTLLLGTPSGSNWSQYQLQQPFVGNSDYNGNPRVSPTTGKINMGAYEQ